MDLFFFRNTYIDKHYKYNKNIKFQKPKDICSALLKSITVKEPLKKNFGKITDPLMLIYYINELDIPVNKHVLESEFINIDSLDASAFHKACDQDEFYLSEIADMPFHDIEDKRRVIEVQNEEIRKKKDLDSIPDIAQHNYLAQRMMFYLGELTDFDRWFLKEYNASVQEIARKLKERNISQDQLQKLITTIETLDSNNINTLIKVGEAQKALISEYMTGNKKECNKLLEERQNIQNDLVEKKKGIDEEVNGFEKALNHRYETLKSDFDLKIQELERKSNQVRIVEFVINRGSQKTKTNNNVLRHEKYEEVMTDVSAGLSPFLVGPAGSGKSTILKQVAFDLKLPYCPMPVNGQTSEYNIIGYNDAQGRYVRTAFRNAYENGGVFLFEEIDAGNPNVLTVINNTIGQDSYMFPDGKVIERHRDFIIGASANTYGRGASLQYIGRNPLDAATVDRFSFTTVYYDTVLEEKLCNHPMWRDYVYEIRRVTESFNMKVLASTRAIVNGCALLNKGVLPGSAEQKVIWKGTSTEDINKVKNSIDQDILNKLFKIDIQNERGGTSVFVQQNNAHGDDEDDDLPF